MSSATWTQPQWVAMSIAPTTTIAMLSPSKPLAMRIDHSEQRRAGQPITSDAAVSVAPVPTIRPRAPLGTNVSGRPTDLGQLVQILGQQPLVGLASDELRRARFIGHV